MTRRMLSQQVAKHLGQPHRNVDKILVQMFSTIVQKICRHEPVKLKYFGKFEVRARRGWVGRHPATGRRVKVRERYFVSFIPGKELKKKVEGFTDGTFT